MDVTRLPKIVDVRNCSKSAEFPESAPDDGGEKSFGPREQEASCTGAYMGLDRCKRGKSVVQKSLKFMLFFLGP